MINDEVMGGLKSALGRGESLKRAMMTLFNAGYKREDIEEAAAVLTEPSIIGRYNQPLNPVPKNAMIKPSAGEALKPASQTPSSNNIQSIQKVSGYGEKNPKENVIKNILIKPSEKELSKPASQTPSSNNIQSIQKVSGYGEKNPRDKIMIFVLISLLLFLTGLLITIFLFKEELINFFNSIFG